MELPKRTPISPMPARNPVDAPVSRPPAFDPIAFRQQQLEKVLAEMEKRLPIIDRLAASDETIQRAAGLGTTLTTTDVQTIQAAKTFDNAPIRVIDANGTLIHSFGTAS